MIEFDDFLETPKGGYRAVHMQVRGANGISAEVQIQPQTIGRVQDRVHGAIYVKWRHKAKLTAEDMVEREADLRRMEDVYERAWREFNESSADRSPSPESPGAKRPEPGSGSPVRRPPEESTAARAETTADPLPDVDVPVGERIDADGRRVVETRPAAEAIAEDDDAAGGGDVLLPAGTFTITTVTVPGAVRLRGQGSLTTVLQSQVADKVVTFSGDRAGLAGLTLDGVNLVSGSTGLYAKAIDQTRLQDVRVRRFDVGLHAQGGRQALWVDLVISNCNTNGKLHGDLDASGDSGGDSFVDNLWIGGLCEQALTTGIDLSYVDRPVWRNTIQKVGFEDNTGIAMNVNGARWTAMPGCWFSGNTTNLAVDDDDDTDAAAENTVIGLHVSDAEVSGGTMSFAGTCQDAVFDRVNLSDVDVTLTLPKNNIVLRDCIEDADVTIAGDGTKWTRRRTMYDDPPASAGTTADATATKAWSVAIDPGQVGLIRAAVTANQTDGEGYGVYHICRHIRRPGAELGYDAQTANFTVGAVLTGATSGATAIIVADSDSGVSGTLTVRDIVGEFENNEIITDDSGGSAAANGTLSEQDVTLLGATTNISAATESAAGMGADFNANGAEVEIKVTGEASKTYEWVVAAQVVVD